MLQMAFGALDKFGRTRPIFKYMCIILISFGFTAWDMRGFFNTRHLNAYERIGLDRQA